MPQKAAKPLPSQPTLGQLMPGAFNRPGTVTAVPPADWTSKLTDEEWDFLARQAGAKDDWTDKAATTGGRFLGGLLDPTGPILAGQQASQVPTATKWGMTLGALLGVPALAMAARSGKTGMTALDMSDSARLGRAAEQGFDTSRPWYHGASRSDRLVEKKALDPRRATSGPMPYFTSDPEIAGSYAVSKADNSLAVPEDYAGWFKSKVGRSTVDIDRLWYHLTPEQRQQVTELLPRIGQTDDGKIVLGEVGSVPGGTSHWEWTLKDTGNKWMGANPLKAAKEIWLNSGILFNDEERFLDVLKLAGISNVAFDSPNMTRPGVLKVLSRVKNPLNVSDPEALKAVIPELEAAAKGRRAPRQTTGADPRDKSIRNPKEWIAMLKLNDPTTWTSIPDWVTEKLRVLGFDGILDRGGKFSGHDHQVLIPFSANQVRTPWAKFDPRNMSSGDLLGSIGATAVTGLAAKELQKRKQEK